MSPYIPINRQIVYKLCGNKIILNNYPLWFFSTLTLSYSIHHQLESTHKVTTHNPHLSSYWSSMNMIKLSKSWFIHHVFYRDHTCLYWMMSFLAISFKEWPHIYLNIHYQLPSSFKHKVSYLANIQLHTKKLA